VAAFEDEWRLMQQGFERPGFRARLRRLLPGGSRERRAAPPLAAQPERLR